MDQLARVYEIVWSLVAISIGGFGFFYTDKFISNNAQAFEKLHKKTGLSLFKKQAEGMKAPYMRLFTKVLGAFFFVVGILMLFGYISIQQQGQGTLSPELSNPNLFSIAASSTAELPNASTALLFVCENKTSFSMTFPDSSHILVLTTDGKITMFPLDNWPGMMVYGNEKSAYSFVEGYSGQVIATDRSGPYSTICHVATSTPAIATSSPNPLTIPRGNRIGYLTNVHRVGSSSYFDFKEIQFFYGKAADAAQRADGNCYIQPGDTGCFTPDGYYIRSINKPTSTLQIASNAKIVVWGTCERANYDGIPITADQFVNGYGSDPCKVRQDPFFYVRNDTPYWIDQDQSGQVTLIWEQYVP